MKNKFVRLATIARNKAKKVAVVGAMACGVMLATAPSNTAEARLFGSGMECDENGGGTWTTRFFGFAISRETTIPNSAFCQ
ncbi:hypothetical protein [Hymenobacter sp. DG01]|uniref:hypothetical protein n=1 Tax=Hymenobacter sp. DG01 TaxID=2584940 RepID=UPI00111CDB76|nr:hypothetical protein [Hymenobacter sp. DG01]